MIQMKEVQATIVADQGFLIFDKAVYHPTKANSFFDRVLKIG
jgi:hypothetical protein